MQVREGAIYEKEEDEGDVHNSDIEPYRRTLSGGDDITVNSS
jgi:hypothetical protein